MKKRLIFGSVIVVVAAICIVVVAQKRNGFTTSAQAAVSAQVNATASSPAPSPVTESAGGAVAVSPAEVSDAGASFAPLRQAAEAHKHLFMFVYAADDEPTRAARKTLEATIAKMPDTAQWVAVDRGAPAQKGIVDKYQLSKAPMPLVLVFAPNGAITGGLIGPQETEEALQNAIASPCKQKCLKVLQEGKLLFLCAQNKATKSNEAAMTGVNGFKDDARFAKFTEVVQVDPTDKAEVKFMAQLKIEPKTDEAVTAFLAPPGAIVGNYKGATDKDTLVAAITAAASGGCGPSGCGSSGCK